MSLGCPHDSQPDSLFERALVRLADNKFTEPLLRILPIQRILNCSNVYHDRTQNIISEVSKNSDMNREPEPVSMFATPSNPSISTVQPASNAWRVKREKQHA